MSQDVMLPEEVQERRPAARMRGLEAAAYIGVAPKTLANWRSAGKGPRFYKIGRVIVYQRDDLDAFFEEHLQAPTKGV
ncbi:MAG: helix-turn-helix domain-containing protein [Hyphomonadaceae bacterium]|nr:helix-turn-helix domain-containing protein [Hyphomonadaceae bacterium]